MSGKGQVELMLGFGVLVAMSFCSLSFAGSALKVGLDNPVKPEKENGGGDPLSGLLGSESLVNGLFGAALAGPRGRAAGAAAGIFLPLLGA